MWIPKWFLPPQEGPQIKYQIVETSAPRITMSEKDARDAISTLSSHPGFVVLTQRLAAQNALLRSKLSADHHTTMREVDFLQAGIYWSNWLAQECQRSSTKMPERRTDAMEEELDAFRAIDAAIERVG